MNNILPGFIDSLAEKDEFKKHVLLNRYGTTNEISEVVSFLASDGAAHITGQNIRVDGGITKSVYKTNGIRYLVYKIISFNSSKKLLTAELFYIYSYSNFK